MSTKVILTAPVEALGEEGSTVAVADGYARNYLLPKGLAIPATAGNLRRVDTLRKRREETVAAQLQEAKELAGKLAKHSFTINAAAGTDGKLFGSVTVSDIADALKAEGIPVDRRKIVLEHPVRELGVFDVEIKLHPEVAAKVKIWIVGAEGQGAPTAKTQEEPAEQATRKSKKAPKKK
jgi:large subunit ribosomal protein L9